VNEHDPAQTPVRLSKLMAQRGLCSRREADRYIEQGLVLVDGRVVDQLGSKVRPDQAITLKREASREQSSRVTILLNKPVGYVSGQAEPGYRPAITLITPENRYADDASPERFRRAMLKGLAPAGRLDIDSRGLLVLTQDGRIARQLIAADSAVEKEYLVWVEGKVADAAIARLRHGLALDGRPLKPARVNLIAPNRLRMVLTEGRKRQVRRMCDQVGLRVTSLVRVRIGRIRLGELPTGQWRLLGSGEQF